MNVNVQSLILGACLSLAGTGCMMYPGPGFVAPGDTMEDEANKAYVAQAQADYEARLQFRRKLVIVPSEKVNVFLSNHVFSDMHVSKKRELLTICESQLREAVGGLRDFEIVGSEAILSGDSSQSGIYRLSFDISDVQVREYNGMLGLSAQNKNNQHRYYVAVKVDATLTDPAGKQVFKYSAVGSSNPSEPVNFSANNSWVLNHHTLVNDATSVAASSVLNSYARDFGPPMYVKELLGGGAFAQISAGSAYGIQPGQKVEFYRNRLRTLPSLPGEPPKTELARDLVGYGVVGARNCPIESDSAWVFVKKNDVPAREGRPDEQAVRLWTSARIVD